MEELNLNRLYHTRFTEEELEEKNKLWEILCRDFFQKYINDSDSVLDIGSGACEFINNIKAEKKYAIDINPHNEKYCDSDVKFFKSDSKQCSALPIDNLDVVFVSNFFEHLPSKDELVVTLQEIHTLLHKKGKLLLLHPNIKCLNGEYWDFFDHHIALTHNSLAEALKNTGFKVKEVRGKFLPYSTKSNLPKFTFMVRLYLRLRIAQRIFGKQMFIFARKTTINHNNHNELP